MEKKSPLGRAYIDRVGGWRCIYAVRELRRGRHKGWFEVSYIDLRDGQTTYVKGHVPDYKTMEGEVINGRRKEEV